MMEGIFWPVLGMLACFAVMWVMMMAMGRFRSDRHAGQERDSMSSAGSPRPDH